MNKTLITSITALAALAFAAGTVLAAGGNDAPELDVLLIPAGQERVDEIGVEMRLEAPQAKAGEALLRMPVRLVGVPTAAYAPAQVKVHDDEGALSLTAVDEAPTSSGVYRNYLTDRDTAGDVRVSYSTPPRAVDSGTRNGPLFDIRRQNDGIMGAGVYFMLLPAADEQDWKITLDWDFSKSPEGTRGAWSLGEGRREVIRSASTLQFTYYAVGNVKSADGDPESDFNMYWLADLPFDSSLLASRIVRLFETMAEFFEKPDESYRVFIRSNPHRGGGGTGFYNSFAFAFGTDQEMEKEGPLMLLAHEIAHNWTRFNAGEEHAETAWYSEGTAEYNKLFMAFRAGLLPREKLLDELNSMAEKYYSNPWMNASSKEAGENYWLDSRAQRVPYGRGFMYLVSTDARLRKATEGGENVQDLMLEVSKRQDAGEKIGNERWQELLAARMGDRASDDFRAMAAGETIVPPDNALQPCFEVYKTAIAPFELGFDRMHLDLVTSLEEQSNARRAGLEEGDRIVSLTPLEALYGDESAMMEMVVSRDGSEHSIRYLPRGEKVEAWQWRNNDDVPDERCGF